MAAGRRIVGFGTGGVLGAALGGVVAYLFAPQSGKELTEKVQGRLDEMRIAGAQAKLEKQRELIGRFRETVEDPTALAGADAKAVAGLSAVRASATRFSLGLDAASRTE